MLNTSEKHYLLADFVPQSFNMQGIRSQTSFLLLLREKLPGNLALADFLCSTLHISEDSAYRRIRGVKQLSIDEIEKLCTAISVSADKMLGLPSVGITFNGQYIKSDHFNFLSYLQAQYQELAWIMSQKNKKITFLCKDIPVYHYYLFPEIAAFKYFSWMRTLLNFPELQDKKFSFHFVPPDFLQWGQKLATLYYQIPGVEILNEDNILTTLRQIEYFKDARLFEKPDDVYRIYESLENMITHLRQMAADEKKFLPGKDSSLSPGDYNLYVNDFYVGDNTLLVEAGGLSQCFIVHSGTNFIRTADNQFYTYHKNFIENLVARSEQISGSNSKECDQFFRQISERINAYKDNKVLTLGNI